MTTLRKWKVALLSLFACVCVALGVTVHFTRTNAVAADNALETIDPEYESWRDWNPTTVTGKDGTEVNAYTGSNEYATERFVTKVSTANGFMVSYDLKFTSSGQRYRMGFLTDGTGVDGAAAKGGFAVDITADGYGVHAGNGSTLSSAFSTNGYAVNQSSTDWYSLKFIYRSGTFYMFVNDKMVYSVTDVAETTEGYVQAQLGSNAYMTNIVLGADDGTDVSINDTDKQYFDNFEGYTYSQFNTTLLDGNYTLGYTAQYHNGRYKTKLTGDYEISLDVNMYDGSSVFWLGFMADEKAVEDVSGGDAVAPDNGLLLQIGQNNAAFVAKNGKKGLGGIEWNPNGNGGVCSVNFRYVNGAISVTVNGTTIDGIMDENVTATEGYFVVQGRSASCKDYIDNFSVTSLTVEDTKTLNANLQANQVLLGFKKTGGYYSDHAASPRFHKNADTFVNLADGAEVDFIEGIEYVPVVAEMYMEQGVYARIGTTGGLRWRTFVKGTDYDAVTALNESGMENVAAEFGTEISANGTEQTEWIAVVNGLTNDSETYSFVGALANIQEGNFDREFTGKGGVKVTYSDGTSEIKYAVSNETLTRTYLGVLTSAVEDVVSTATGAYTVEVVGKDGNTVYTKLPAEHYAFLLQTYEQVAEIVAAKGV